MPLRLACVHGLEKCQLFVVGLPTQITRSALTIDARPPRREHLSTSVGTWDEPATKHYHPPNQIDHGLRHELHGGLVVFRDVHNRSSEDGSSRRRKKTRNATNRLRPGPGSATIKKRPVSKKGNARSGFQGRNAGAGGRKLKLSS